MSNEVTASPGWRVSFSVVFPHDAQMDETVDTTDLVDVLVADGAAEVVTIVGTDRLDVDLSVNADEVWDAIDSAAALWESAAEQLGLQEGTLLRVHGATFDEIRTEVEAAVAFPELLGLAEVAERLGVTKQRISELRKADRLPDPSPNWPLVQCGLPSASTSSGGAGAASRVAQFRARPVCAASNSKRGVRKWPQPVPGRPNPLAPAPASERPYLNASSCSRSSVSCSTASRSRVERTPLLKRSTSSAMSWFILLAWRSNAQFSSTR